MWNGYRVRTTDVPTSSNVDESTVQTIHAMIALVISSADSPAVSHVVNTLLVSLPSHPSNLDITRAVFRWVKGKMRFEEDEEVLAKMGYEKVDKELLISPELLILMDHPSGDCDDYSTLLATLLYALHIPVWFVVIAADEELPWKWSHVYCATVIEGRRIPLDASHGNLVGWEHTPAFRKMEIRVI